jgi:hypothetical protein
MKTDQFLLRPNDELIKKLRDAALRYNKSSGQQVALEVIEQYLDFWEKAEDKKLQEINRQRDSLDAELKEANGGHDSRKASSKKPSKPSNKKR